MKDELDPGPEPLGAQHPPRRGPPTAVGAATPRWPWGPRRAALRPQAGARPSILGGLAAAGLLLLASLAAVAAGLAIDSRPVVSAGAATAVPALAFLAWLLAARHFFAPRQRGWELLRAELRERSGRPVAPRTPSAERSLQQNSGVRPQRPSRTVEFSAGLVLPPSPPSDEASDIRAPRRAAPNRSAFDEARSK